MRKITLLHNPGAGDEAHDEEHITRQLKAAGYECLYISIKKDNWKLVPIPIDHDFIVIAGGDGTVRKVVRHLLEVGLIDDTVPLAVLPVGTANNIARTLYCNESIEDIIRSWKKGKATEVDIWNIDLPDHSYFFGEGTGFGVFPHLIERMRYETEDDADPDKKLAKALEVLLELIHSYPARACEIIADGRIRSGKYILAEMMNIYSIGPNLRLAPHAVINDGLLDIVLVAEDQRDELANYVSGKIKGAKVHFEPNLLRAKDIQINWDDLFLHVDDELVTKSTTTPVHVTRHKRALSFLIS